MPLEGAELEHFRQAELAKKESAAAAAELAKLTAMEDIDSDLSDDDEPMRDGSSRPSSSFRRSGAVGSNSDASQFSATYDIYVKDGYRSGGFFKQNQSFRMFPVSVSRGWVDDYGEAVDPSIFVNSEAEDTKETKEEVRFHLDYGLCVTLG